MSSGWVPPPSSADADLVTDTLHRCAQDTNEERNLFLGDVMPALQELGRKLKLEVHPPPAPHPRPRPRGLGTREPRTRRRVRGVFHRLEGPFLT
jgi:hypothetical protein